MFQGDRGDKGDKGDSVSHDIKMEMISTFMFFSHVRISSVYQGKIGLTGPVGPPGQKVNSFVVHAVISVAALVI